MKLSPILKSEPTKPSQKKGFLVGFMLSWEWEKAVEWIKTKVNNRKIGKGK